MARQGVRLALLLEPLHAVLGDLAVFLVLGVRSAVNDTIAVEAALDARTAFRAKELCRPTFDVAVVSGAASVVLASDECFFFHDEMVAVVDKDALVLPRRDALVHPEVVTSRSRGSRPKHRVMPGGTVDYRAFADVSRARLVGRRCLVDQHAMRHRSGVIDVGEALAMAPLVHLLELLLVDLVLAGIPHLADVRTSQAAVVRRFRCIVTSSFRSKAESSNFIIH